MSDGDIRWIDVVTVENAGSHEATGTYFTWFPRESMDPIRRGAAERTFDMLKAFHPGARVRLWSATVVEGWDDELVTEYVWREFSDDEPSGHPDRDTHPEQTSTCRHCKREITLVGLQWVDEDATGDDAVWRETCDEHDTVTAEHEPQEA